MIFSMHIFESDPHSEHSSVLVKMIQSNDAFYTGELLETPQRQLRVMKGSWKWEWSKESLETGKNLENRKGQQMVLEVLMIDGQFSNGLGSV